MKKASCDRKLYRASFTAAVLGAAAAAGLGTASAQASQVFSDPLYVTDTNTSDVIVYNTSGIASTTISKGATSNSNPTAVSFDSSGNAYISYYNSGDVYEVPAAGGAGSTFATESEAFGSAFDAQGNLYVSNYGTQNILKISPGGSASTFVTSVNGAGPLTGVAIDSAGDMFVVTNDGSNSAIVEYAATGGVPGTTATTIATGSKDSALTSPYQIAVDKSGDLFVINDSASGTTSANAVLEFSPSGSTYTASMFVSDLTFGSRSRGLAFDSAGDLFVTAWNGTDDIIQQIGQDGVAIDPTTVLTTPFTGANEIGFQIAAVPEPATAGLCVLGIAGAALRRRRRRA